MDSGQSNGYLRGAQLGDERNERLCARRVNVEDRFAVDYEQGYRHIAAVNHVYGALERGGLIDEIGADTFDAVPEDALPPHNDGA